MTEIPNAFGGFAPFPNTIMIPTMGLQSDVIGFRFGFGYEKGKRTLRAMSNEQFNTLDEAAEQAIYKEHDSTAINFFKLEIQNWTDLQKIIIEKSVEIETMKANRTPTAFREIFNGFVSGFSAQQSDDAANFFSSLTDPIMKLIAYFGAGKTPPTQGPSQLDPNRPLSTAQVAASATSTKISASERTALMALYSNNIKQLNQAMAQSEARRRKGGLSGADQTKLYQNQSVIRAELKQQKSWLANVTAWRNPY